MNARASILCLVSLFAVLGCARRGHVASSSSPSAPPEFTVGQKLVLWAPAGIPCPVRSAISEADALSGRAIALEGHPSVSKPLSVTVRGVVDDDVELIARVAQTNGSESFLILPRGAAIGCVHRDVTALTAVSSRVGQELVFAPWRRECREIHAAGQAPEALLVDSDAGVRMKSTTLKLGPATGEALAQGKSGTTLWLGFGDGLLDVRADSVAGCFVEPSNPAATKPESVDARLAPGRCQTDASDPRHTSCGSTIAIWEGATTSRSLALRRVWRTMGALHFYDGAPVDGSRFARTVVGVALDPPESEDERSVHGGLGSAVERALVSASGGRVRAARPEDTQVSYKVRVAVQTVAIGELARSETTAQSQYKERDDVRTNPKKEQARTRAERARERVREAADDFAREKQQAEETKRRLYEECKRQAANIDQQGLRTAASGGCDIGNIAIDVSPSRAVLDEAERERDQAESDYQNEPDTITVPIMRTHTYKKQLFSRSASATVLLELAALDQAPRSERIPVSFAWQDYEVQAAPQYNVPGHTPASGPIDDGRALLGPLGGRIALVVAQKVKQAVFAAALEDAKKAFLAAGNPPSRPGFEHVDAIAFETAEKRLERVALQSRASVGPKGSFALPTAAASLADDECLLAVAVATTGNENARLALATRDRRYADLRARPFAALEICKSDVGAAPSEILLESSDAVEVRWGLFITRSAL